MAEALPQLKETNPILNAQPVASKAEGYEAFAKTLGAIAGASEKKVETFEEEASQTNMLQTQSMLSDVETDAKIQMYQNPGSSKKIAMNAAETVGTIKQSASLNDEDRKKFNYIADNSVRGVKLQAAKTSIDLTNESAKYATLSAFMPTLQQIKENLYTDPKAADILIQAQYGSLVGQVRAGILTANEAATLHKQVDEEIKRAQIRGSHYRSGDATPADVNAIESFSPNAAPYSNAGLPMSETTRYMAVSHLDNLSAQDIKAAYANGSPVPANALMWIKSDETAAALQNYKWGSAQATGDIHSGKSWQELKREQTLLNTSHLKLTNEQEGYRDRLNNHIIGIEKGGRYSDYISQTPDGAKAYLDFAKQNAVVESHVYTGSPEQVAAQKNAAHLKNLNALTSRVNAIGIGMDIPDQYRNPIPSQYTVPVQNSFNKDTDPSTAINMLAAFDDKNRVYVANAMPDSRKRLTVYETGKIMGKADAGFLSDFWHSQQDGVDYKNLQTDKSGMSDNKIKDLVNSSLTDINKFLATQPNGLELNSASTMKAVRYVKYMALKNNDPTFEHKDDYIKSYVNNIGRAYQPVSSWSYTMDKNVIPIEKPQMDILADHALTQTYKKMADYMSHDQVLETISRNQPRVISSPTGRITVVDQYGRAIADKKGHHAFDEFFTDDLMKKAEHDMHENRRFTSEPLTYNNPFMKRSPKPYEFEIRLGENLLRNK